MIFLYLENKLDELSITKEEALPALESQVLEIFSGLDSMEAVVLGLIIDDYLEIRIFPFSKFVWRIEVINMRNNKKSHVYYSTQKVKQFIKDIFHGINPLETNDFP